MPPMFNDLSSPAALMGLTRMSLQELKDKTPAELGPDSPETALGELHCASSSHVWRRQRAWMPKQRLEPRQSARHSSGLS